MCPLLPFVWHSALCLWLVFLFLIPRLSAVRDLRQELANALDLFFAPNMNGCRAGRNRLRSRHLCRLQCSYSACCAPASTSLLLVEWRSSSFSSKWTR